jgi:hypothetical protein
VVFISFPTTPHQPLHLLPDLSSSTLDTTSPELRIGTRNNNKKLKEIREEEQPKKRGDQKRKKDVTLQGCYCNINVLKEKRVVGR